MRIFRIILLERSMLAVCLGLAVAVLFVGCATQNSGHSTGAADVASSSAEITSIDLSEETGAVNVRINGTQPLTYTSVKQPVPLGVVLYFPNTRLHLPETKLPSSITPVNAIHADQVDAKSNTTRIEINLASDVPYNVVQDGSALKIQFAKPDSLDRQSNDTSLVPAVAAAPAQGSDNTPPALPSQSDKEAVTPSDVYQGTGLPIGNENQIWVNRIDFLGEQDGRSTLSIETTKKVDFSIEKVSDKLLELRLFNANIAEFRQRPLITTRFASAVNRIMPVQLPTMKDFSLFSIELREPVAYYTEQVGGLLLVHFEASSIPPSPADEANLPAWKKALEETIGSVDFASLTPKGEQTGGDAKVTEAGAPAETNDLDSSEMSYDAEEAMVLKKRTKKFTGEKIALDFFQTDVKNVFRILREVSGKNFAIDKDVSGKVTLTLEKPVPWDQVLDLVLRMNQLGMIVEGDIYRIATLTTLKQENDLRKAQIAALQKEKEQIKALEPLETRYIPISYSDAKNEILPHIENILTKDRGSATVDEKNNQIIITDTADKVGQAEDIARLIDKVTAQVIIEARVVEVEESFTKEIGINWSAKIGPVNLNEHGSEYTSDIAMNYAADNSTNGFQLVYDKIAGTPFSLDAKLTAIEANGNGKILSAPKIVTLNNKKAMISQGSEVGYLERDSAGGSSVKFKKVDLKLEVTPHVTPDNRISMTMYITKNDVTDYVDTVPIIATNEATTELLVNDGDTVVIGGIIKDAKTKEKTAFPGLYKIPVLGWLFQKNLDNAEKRELLIFMNPKIVQLEQRQIVN
jgi:type IV pilus assembly protein PilQ